MICEIVASIELATRGTQGLRLVSWHEILGKAPPETRSATNPMRMPVTITYAGHHMSGGQHVDTAVIPDAIFGLADDRPDGTTQYRFFALEADRGTMPLHRADLRQSSYLRKLLAYRKAAARSQYRTQLGLPNFLVLTVTMSASRAQRMAALLDDLTDGAGSAMFLFKAISLAVSVLPVPQPCPQLLTEPWQRVGYPLLRIDQAKWT